MNHPDEMKEEHIKTDHGWLNRLAGSACCIPEMPLDEMLTAYRNIGFCKFEAFTKRVKSALDISQSPEICLKSFQRHNTAVLSVHLYAIQNASPEEMGKAIKGAEFAQKLGASIVLFKAKTRELYKQAAKPFLDGIAHLNVEPVLQNHHGSAISTLEDYEDVLEGISDTRMKALLEVGHFHSSGVSWRQGFELLKDRIALIHIKDQIGAQSVPFGTGEIDLVGLFRHMKEHGYTGDYVVEMEVKDEENTLKYLTDAVAFLEKNCKEYLL